MVLKGAAVYQVADNLGIRSLKTEAKQPGVISVLRVTAYYPERRIRHSVATLVESNANRREMRIVYEGFNKHQAVTLNVSRESYGAILNALQQAKFDKLLDQPDVSYKDHCLWLIQRASGIYIHEIIVSPDNPELPYSAIVNAIDLHLPEAIREIPLA